MVLALAACSAASRLRAEQPARLQIRPPAPGTEVRRLEPADLLVEGVPDSGNPFDPDEISVDAEFTAPSGKVLAIPAYWHADYTRQLEGRREVLRASGKPHWRVRFAPLEEGRHAVRVAAEVRGKLAAEGRGEISAGPGKSRGFVRIEKEARRNFRLDDGTPLFLIGLCACWHGERGTYDYDDWLPAHEKARINYICIWMWPHAFGIEWEKGDRLRYRLDRAWTLDHVLAEARRRGVHVMLCLDYHGMFEVKKDFFGGNNYWPQHPYNVASGGPCTDQNEFFTKEEARELYKKRLRYIVARWSAFSNVLAWQFFNEIDNVYKYLKHEDVVAWHREMARHLRSIDPYGHLISSSLTGGSERRELWELPELEFSQYHSYNEEHPADVMARTTERFLSRYRKPFFVGEYGTDFRGWKPEADPHFRALRQAVWSGAFTGAAGTGMSWWWESIHAANLYGIWSSLAGFLEGTGVASGELGPVKVESTREPGVKALALAGKREALVWLLDPAFSWPSGAMVADPPPVSGAEVRLPGLEPGSYVCQWWDPRAAAVVRADDLEVGSAPGILSPPPFQVDIAARVRARGGASGRP